MLGMASHRRSGAQKEQKIEIVCRLQRLEQSFLKGLLSCAKHRSNHRFHSWSRVIKLFGCIFKIQQDQNGPEGPRKSFIDFRQRNLLLQRHAVWVKKVGATCQRLVT